MPCLQPEFDVMIDSTLDFMDTCPPQRGEKEKQKKKNLSYIVHREAILMQPDKMARLRYYISLLDLLAACAEVRKCFVNIFVPYINVVPFFI